MSAESWRSMRNKALLFPPSILAQLGKGAALQFQRTSAGPLGSSGLSFTQISGSERGIMARSLPFYGTCADRYWFVRAAHGKRARHDPLIALRGRSNPTAHPYSTGSSGFEDDAPPIKPSPAAPGL
jgi:hypothetical protein